MKNPNNLPAQNGRVISYTEGLPTIWLDGLKEEMATVESMLIQALDSVDDAQPLPETVSVSVRYKIVPEINITISRNERLLEV
jgi:hypothetical protein